MKQTLLGIDQTINTLVYIPGDGLGMADESLSARLWRLHVQGLLDARWYRFVDALFFWQASHCFASYLAEAERRQLPDWYRGEAVSASVTPAPR